MNIKEKAKEKLEQRVQRLEQLIEKKGVGSSYLDRAKQVQRSANVANVVSAAVTIVGISIWAINKLDRD